MNGFSSRFELYVDNKSKSVDFYTKVLNFSIERTSHGHYFLPEVNTQRKGLGVEIVLMVDNIEAEYDRITDSGCKLHEKLTKREWGLTDFRIIDPDGYYLRITSKN